MQIQTNHSLSVDCVIFGYDGQYLKILLVNQRRAPLTHLGGQLMKLPGSMIYQNESLSQAAHRVLRDSTGLERVYLEQTTIFSDPQRVNAQELEWIARYHNIITTRVVTVGYYALIHINKTVLLHTKRKGAKWVNIDDVNILALDHNDILKDALLKLRSSFEQTAKAFEMLPRKFTFRALQNLYSAVMGSQVDSRNFRKKILSENIVRPTGEKEQGVAHKPAEYYVFNPVAFKKTHKK